MARPVPRTPDRIKDKTAESNRFWCVGVGVASAGISYAAFAGNAPLTGLGFAAGAIGLWWIATKIRVWRDKVVEGGIYR